MGQYYYVNKNAQLNGDHEVYVSSFTRLPEENNRMYLGIYEPVLQRLGRLGKPTRNLTADITAVTRVIRPAI